MFSGTSRTLLAVSTFSSLSRHLEASATLIVVCSPNARSSEFVNDEIRRFAELKGADRIVPVLLAGVPEQRSHPREREDEKAFPEAHDVLEMPLAANYLQFDVSKRPVGPRGLH